MDFLFILLILLVLLAVLAIQGLKKRPEGKRPSSTRPPYDAMYARIYDTIWHDRTVYKAELDQVNRRVTTESVLLDVGCGLGHLVADLPCQATGLDVAAMVDAAKQRYPNRTFYVGDVLDRSFPSESFTHITCLGNTLFYIEKKHLFFHRAFQWLEPGGTLLVAVRWRHPPRDKFKANHFSYQNKWVGNDFVETIKTKGETIHYKHAVFPEKEKVIVETAQKAGFVVVANHDILILQKV
jgi:ubiquinone/menaquinone biosynthesis C-methylase UbiE